MVKAYILVVCYLEILDRLENGRLVPYKSGPGKGGVLCSQRGSFGSCPGRFWRAWHGGRQTRMDGRHQGLAGLSLELLVHGAHVSSCQLDVILAGGYGWLSCVYAEMASVATVVCIGPGD